MIPKNFLCRHAALFYAAIFLNLIANGLVAENLRPPSVPLVACDPYFSIWSPADRATGLLKIEGNIKAWRVGTVEQPVLQKHGDDLRIDWGYFYLALPGDSKDVLTANTTEATRGRFLADGKLSAPAAGSALQNNDRNDTVLAFATDSFVERLTCFPSRFVWHAVKSGISDV